MIDKTHRPQRRADVRSETVEGEIVLYDPVSSRAVYLNETAALIWSLCDGGASIAEITELLQREMGDTEAPIAQDVEDTIARFLDSGLVR